MMVGGTDDALWLRRYDGVTLVVDESLAETVDDVNALEQLPVHALTSRTTTRRGRGRPSAPSEWIAACGPVSISFDNAFGKTLGAAEYAAASGERDVSCTGATECTRVPPLEPSPC